MQSWIVVTPLVYVGLLFAIAWRGDRVGLRAGRKAPILYSLSLGIYCSSWTFYGSVGRAASSGFDFVPIYLGPIIVIGLCWPVLAKIVRVAKAQNTVSIADFIGSRYGKSQAVAAFVALVAVIGITPYIGLQLKAVTSSFAALTGTAPSFFGGTAMVVTGLMAVFTILFGLRNITASEHHPGLMNAIAFESLVKLVAFLVVGAAVTFVLSPGPREMFEQARADPGLAHVLDLNLGRPEWWSMTLLAGLAILCLPRQFHVAVVENTSEAALPKAAWLFPLYLVAINLFVVPVALAGLTHFGSNGPDADTFVVSLPVDLGASGLGLLAFIGGLSAATAMVIVAAVALSTMVSNDLVMPLLLRLPAQPVAWLQDRAPVLLGIRRLAVIVILLLANGYNILVGSAYPLSSTGILAFVAVAQFAPAMLGGLYWRRGNRTGALTGIGAGFLLWGYTQILPTFAEAGLLAPGLVEHGPWNLDWLRPYSLFGLAGLDPLSHAVLWSLGTNCICYVIGSLVTRASVVEQRQAAVFVAAVADAPYPAVPFEGQTPLADLVGLAETYLGGGRALEAFRHHLDLPTLASTDAALRVTADLDALRFTERLIAGAIGAASARVVVAGSLQKKLLSRTEAMAVLDEASQAIHFNRALLRATLENIDQGIAVLDSTLHVAAWNRRLLELADLPTSLVQVGTSLAEIVAFNRARGEYDNGGEITTLLQRIEQGGGRETYERTRPDGTVLEITVNPMPDGGVVATYTDVTERHDAAAALREANESLERRVADRTTALAVATADAQRANLSKTRFFAAASHDLLQPLHAARLFTTALAEQRDDPLVERIDASLRSVETLLVALLDVSKLDAGAVTAQPIAFSIDLLTTLAQEFTAIARERGIELRLVQSTAGVRSDPALLRRIVQNFLSNALRYTESGRVLVGCRRRGPDLRIEVWDTGPGIPEEHLGDIFVEFQRLASQTGETERGLGLGLAIADRIARMLGHTLGVRSQLGRGSCFWVTIPRAEVAAIPAGAPRRRRIGYGGALVVCIDDNATILDGMAALLQGWDCRVITGKSAEEALARLEDQRPDIAIVDYHLDRNCTGLAALDALRTRFGDVPRIVLTADHGEATRELITGQGYPVLYKPVKPAALRALLSRAIQLAQQPAH